MSAFHASGIDSARQVGQTTDARAPAPQAWSRTLALRVAGLTALITAMTVFLTQLEIFEAGAKRQVAFFTVERRITVSYARWEHAGTSEDVTATLRALCDGHTTCSARRDFTRIAGDRTAATHKTLRVAYACNGRQMPAVEMSGPVDGGETSIYLSCN